MDELNLMVQYLVKEGRCNKEHIKEHLKLYEEKVKDTINMNTKLRDVILRGLREKEEYELCEQVHKEFLRINWKFRKLVQAPWINYWPRFCIFWRIVCLPKYSEKYVFGDH